MVIVIIVVIELIKSDIVIPCQDKMLKHKNGIKQKEQKLIRCSLYFKFFSLKLAYKITITKGMKSYLFATASPANNELK